MTLNELKSVRPDIYELACKRIKDQGNEPVISNVLSECLGRGGFVWFDSPEGHDFWDEIDDGNFTKYDAMYPKSKKKVTELKKNEGILCTTEQEANAICRLMHDAGLRWHDGRTYIEQTYSVAGELPMIYIPNDGKYMTRSSAGVVSYPASDFLTPAPIVETPVEQPRKIIDYLKVGDKVWDCLRGKWVEVMRLDFSEKYPIKCEDSNGVMCTYTPDGVEQKSYAFPTLHLTEWHPERGEPIPALPDPNEPRVGEVCLFWDSEDYGTIGVLASIDSDSFHFKCMGNEIYYMHCYPLRGKEMPNWNELLNIKSK